MPGIGAECASGENGRSLDIDTPPCEFDDGLAIVGLITGFGLPLIMLVLTFGLISHFWRQLNKGANEWATATIVGGYVALLAFMYVSVLVLSATASSWAIVLISFTMTWGIIVFIYSPMWLIALLVFALRRRRSA